MVIKINCTFNDSGAWCTNKKVKRSLLGLGARCCIIYPPSKLRECKYQAYHPRPTTPPSPRGGRRNEI